MISVVIPTYNAASYLPNLLQQIKRQTLPHELIIIDSESTDTTKELASCEDITFITINRSEFNHGTTRNLGVEVSRFDIVLFLTQDASPASPDAFEQLVTMLCNRDDIAMAYGRQLPYPEADIFGRLARLTNYPDRSLIKTKVLIPQMGIKTCSCSNSFAVYRKADLKNVGGFPSDTILGEDVSVAARFIMDGKAVAYCAEAIVYHSHNYTLIEEFKRYFDIGVFHEDQQYVLKWFTKAESEGVKYVVQEWKYLKENGHSALIPIQLLRTLSKYIGYRIGRLHKKLPIKLKQKISMHSGFWVS